MLNHFNHFQFPENITGNAKAMNIFSDSKFLLSGVFYDQNPVNSELNTSENNLVKSNYVAEFNSKRNFATYCYL